jgi:predicted O-methyltransferase YrrM
VTRSSVHEALVRLAPHSGIVRLAVYVREMARQGRAARRGSLGEWVREFPRWQGTIRSGATPLQTRTPWITYGAIRFLEGLMRPEMRVFEYGAGGSSLFFAARVKEGVSVEHDPGWAAAVRSALSEAGHTNWTVELVEPGPETPAGEPSDPEGYASSDEALVGRSFRAYAAAIEAHAPPDFDLVIIDGRARPSCFRHAWPRVKPGGWLLLDNAERATYRRVHSELERLGWPRSSFPGPSPHAFNFSETCLWQRPA